MVNLRRWFTRPWRKAAQRGDFDTRFTYARRKHEAGLIFLRSSLLGSAHGRELKEDPFPALVAMARKSPVPVYLVPELFVWEKASHRLQPSLLDYIFGSPEAPGFIHTMIAFRRNYKRAQFRIGEAMDLQRFVLDNQDSSDQRIARKVRSALYHHLARETRAVFGPPRKHPERIIDETLRDRSLRRSLEAYAATENQPLDLVAHQARKDLRSIAARFEPTVLAMVVPILSWVFNRIYAGIEVDEAGLDRAMKAASRAPVVFCPSHKSHIDYLVMSFILWKRGYSTPLVAAGANLSFFPLGPLFRRGGAFFLRRSFKGDPVYTAVFKAYLKKLVRDGVHQEFFPEGGRSRTGKLLTPKLGMLTWQVEAILDGARDDLNFIPVSIAYEKVPESKSYSHELAGGEKRPEDFKALLSTWKVLRSRFGRIHLSFDEPISLVQFIKGRGLTVEEASTDEAAKRSLVRALAHRIMYGIDRVSTITPQALVSAALLAQRGRGVASSEADLHERVGLLRQLAEDQHRSVSPASIDEALEGFVQEGIVRCQEAKGHMMYLPVEERRHELAFHKNTLMNWVAPQSLVADGLLVEGDRATRDQVRDNAMFLSRLFKFEFTYQVGIAFDALFSAAAESLERLELVQQNALSLSLAAQLRARPKLVFLADLLRDYLESYLAATLTLEEVAMKQSMDRKDFVQATLETARAEFLAGRLDAPEALSRTNMENALLFFLDKGLLVESDKLLRAGDPRGGRVAISSLAERIGYHLRFPASPNAVRQQAV